MFKVTREWLLDNATPKGGWTRYQLQLVGIEWPPVHGWMAKAADRLISDESKKAFETLGRIGEVEL